MGLDSHGTQLTDLLVGQIDPRTSRNPLQVFESIAPNDCRGAGRKLALGDADFASDDQRQAKELAGLICKTPQAIDAFIHFCSQQPSDLLAPRTVFLMSLQVILRMRWDMSGEDPHALQQGALEITMAA